MEDEFLLLCYDLNLEIFTKLASNLWNNIKLNETKSQIQALHIENEKIYGTEI